MKYCEIHRNHFYPPGECAFCDADRAGTEKDYRQQITRLLEFVRLVKDCPPTELHLLPVAADALLSEMGE